MQGDETIDQRLLMFKEQRQKVIQQITELKETLDLINYKCWYYETAQASGTCTIHDSLKPEDIPEDILKFRAKEKD